MHKVNISREIAYAPVNLLELASDVANYPKFIPLIKAVRIWDKNQSGDEFCAELLIGYKNFRIPFSTKVEINHENFTIKTKNIESKNKGFFSFKNPIKFLECEWRFEELNNGSNANVKIDLEFQDLILGSIVGANLDRATNYLINAFEKEAINRFN